jgi:CRISPR type III-A-associated protein Csm2
MMSYGSRGNLPHRDNRSVPALDPNYLKGTYFDSENKIKCELLTSEADRIAKLFKDSNVGFSQVRKFFAAVRAIARDHETNFSQLQPHIQALKNKAAYFVGRGQNANETRGRENFKKFIDANVDLSTKSEESFRRGFVPHFEAVIAYLRYHKP